MKRGEQGGELNCPFLLDSSELAKKTNKTNKQENNLENVHQGFI